MTRPNRRDGSRSSLGLGWSALLLVTLIVVWFGGLTFLFTRIFDNFLYRLTHPFDSGFSKGPWGFLFLYAILSLPVLPLHGRLMNWIEGERRRAPSSSRQKRRP